MINIEMMEHEEFLTPEDYGVELMPVVEEVHKRHKKQKPQIDGQMRIEDIVITGTIISNRVNLLLDNEEPIGETLTGLPLYRADNPAEIYKRIPTIDEIPNVDVANLNKDYLAYIRTESLDFIKNDILKTEISDSELVKKLVVFKHGTSLFFDKFDSIRFGGNDVIAVKNNILLDKHECPFDTESYIYLANLTKKSEKIKKKHTTVVDSSVEHLINLPTGRVFFARTRDAIETKFSKIGKNGVVDRH